MLRSICTIVGLMMALSAVAQIPHYPTITPTVTVEGGLRHFHYSLFNDATDGNGSPTEVWAFTLFMPTPGGINNVNHNQPSGWRYDFSIVGSQVSEIVWAIKVFGVDGILPGATAGFDIYVPSTTGAMYVWPGQPYNWDWAGPWGGWGGAPFLPVPAPEPGTWLGLACGLGALALRSKQRSQR